MALGEFYGINPITANLELLARFFEKYPIYADKTFLAVKVCMSFCTSHPLSLTPVPGRYASR